MTKILVDLEGVEPGQETCGECPKIRPAPYDQWRCEIFNLNISLVGFKGFKRCPACLAAEKYARELREKAEMGMERMALCGECVLLAAKRALKEMGNECP